MGNLVIQGLFSGVESAMAQRRGEYLRTAIRLNPRDPRRIARVFMHQIEVSYYYERDYTIAADAATQTIAAYPGYPAAIPLAGGGTWAN